MYSPGPGTAKPLSSSGQQKLSTKSTTPTWGFGTSRVSVRSATQPRRRHLHMYAHFACGCSTREQAHTVWLTPRTASCLPPLFIMLQRLAEYCNDSPGPGTYYA
jgi:hypothetical protein